MIKTMLLLRTSLFLAFIGLFSLTSNAQKIVKITSPDNNITLTTAVSSIGTVTYGVIYKNKPILEPSSLGFSLSKPQAKLTQFSIISVDSSMTDETWQPVWGEVSRIRNHYKALTLTLKDQTGILLKVAFRVFNEGVGFRYEFPKQDKLNHFVVADELTQFNLAGDHKAFWIPGDYDTNEYLYNTTKLSEVNAVAAAAREPDIALKSVIGANFM